MIQLKGVQGFTLLELLVVLAIMGVMVSIVVTGFERMYLGLQSRLQRDQVLSEVAGLGYRAYILGQSFSLDGAQFDQPLADGQPLLSLPEGWEVKTKKPILYLFNGYCSGGRLEIISPSGAKDIVSLEPPRCVVVE